MFRIFRFFAWIIFLFLFLWFSTKVPLGKYTLVEHVKRIWSTKETQALVEGTKKTVQDELKDIRSSDKQPEKKPERDSEKK